GLSRGHCRSADSRALGRHRRSVGSARPRVRREFRANQSQHHTRAGAAGRAGRPARMSGADAAAEDRSRLEPRSQEMIDLLGRLVNIESPSDDPAGLSAFAGALEELFGGLGSLSRAGQHLVLDIVGEDAGLPRAVALCHYDTVWPKGTLERIPFSVDAGGVARGPGCFD